MASRTSARAAALGVDAANTVTNCPLHDGHPRRDINGRDLAIMRDVCDLSQTGMPQGVVA